MATRSDIERAINEGEAKTLDDIRRDVRPVTRSPLQPDVVVRSDATQLVLHTDRGRIVIELFGDDAPQMVESFASLAEAGFFRELPFAPYAAAGEVAYRHLQDISPDAALTTSALSGP